MSIIGRLDTWYFWAYYATGLFVMACTLTVHMLIVGMKRLGPILLVMGVYMGMVGAIVGGIQAGPYPVVSPNVGVATIRMLWVSGITLGIIASGLYLWSMRERDK
jgi:hypothetical protein